MKLGDVVTVPNTSKIKLEDDAQRTGTIIEQTTTDIHVLDNLGYIHIVSKKLAYPAQRLTSTVSDDTLP